MSTPVVIRPLALTDIDDVYRDLQGTLPGLGDRFLARLKEVIEHIERSPQLYGVVYGTVRAVRLRRFQYVLYYRVTETYAEVLAVIHGARRESAWKSRVD